MSTPEAMTVLLFDHVIAKAEQSLAAAALKVGPRGGSTFNLLKTHVAELYDRRRLALEEMMLLPFQSLKD